MITTLAGTNSFLLRQELRRLVDAFVSEYSDMGLEKYDGEELDPKQLPSIVQALPFLAAKRMVVLNRPSAQKAVAEQLEKLMDDIPDSTHLVIVEPSPDKRTSYYKTLQKKTDVTMFDELSEQSLIKWVAAEVKALGGAISAGDAMYLVHRVGPNQAGLANELKKLVLFDPHITKDTINEMTDPLPQSSVFDLLDAAFAGSTHKMLALYQEQRQQKVEPLAIMAMIAWQLHILALVKAAGDRNPQEIASQAKISPFVVRKTLGIARRISGTQLKQLVADAYQLDIRLKSQPVDADDALQHFLLEVASNPN